jgi:hypothetical protein
VQVTGQPARSVPLDPIEVQIPAELPSPGSETRQLKVLDQSFSTHVARFTFAGWGGTAYDLDVRLNRPHVTARGGQLSSGKLHMQMPEGAGYQVQTVEFAF